MLTKWFHHQAAQDADQEKCGKYEVGRFPAVGVHQVGGQGRKQEGAHTWPAHSDTLQGEG